MRFPSVWRITPGSMISAEKYTIDATTRRGSIDAAITPPGSTRSKQKSEKYHHGRPFCVLTTVVHSPRSGLTRGEIGRASCRERGQNWEGAGSCKKNSKAD